MALAVTEKWRVWGTVTPGPRRMRDVPRTHAVSVTHSSRHTRWESVIHAVSKPRDSASWTWRTIAGTGWLFMMPTSNFTARPGARPCALEPDRLVGRCPPLRVPHVDAAHQVDVRRRDRPGDRPHLAGADREAIDRRHRGDLVAAPAQESLVGGVQLCAVDLALHHVHADDVGGHVLDDRRARDGLEDVVAGGGRAEPPLADHEERGAGALGDAAAPVQEDRLVRAVDPGPQAGPGAVLGLGRALGPAP